MPDSGNRHTRRIFHSLIALISGFLIGALMRHETGDETAARDMKAFESKPENRALNSSSELDMQGKRQVREQEDTISFSSSQWSKLLRYPEEVRIQVADCMPDLEVPVLNDVRLIGRLFQPRTIDLAGPAAFYGWDEKMTREMQSALVNFGHELSRTEARGARYAYPAGGEILFDLSGVREERHAVFAQLKSRLNEILGEKKAEKFALLSGMEGLAVPLPDTYRHQSEVVFTRDYHPETGPQVSGDEVAFRKLELQPRIRHLWDGIDWYQLKSAAPPAAESSR